MLLPLLLLLLLVSLLQEGMNIFVFATQRRLDDGFLFAPNNETNQNNQNNSKATY
jgi:hypothetical protein